ncbi:hydroxyacylglutathione hydrolase [Shewanella eurypsychrophilus]|uniref:Hydroxyacylglutathione hydrolase n=1 Tax=Shewanella eurypsychrophilus TaxID=2593656 RepID=A0ABX6V7Q1_9GAMM|nr:MULTISPECIES: hydroxyacylglutathione hydrolase [Shewanella]QFU22609.1 hydroxyacylglutathione hydrolase [Shewanella sp. YLB-09]QPG57898.1 hydroxyacylglutathione hydrolase [Shewanella eurypsychrophilus]
MTANETKKLTITAIPAFNDNYIWAISQENSRSIYVVDPGDSKVVIDYLVSHQLELAGILVTHHHPDHTGGIPALLAHSKHRLEIYGPASENINDLLNPIEKQTEITLDKLGQVVEVIQLPGHTSGHIGYLMAGELFCGDTLFSGGCGRLFEGTAQQMYHSLSLLSLLPADTRVYCAHEYTLANLTFALEVDPTNQKLIQYHHHCQQQRKNHLATIPSSIAIERNINPFLRCNTDTIKASVSQQFKSKTENPVDIFALLRQWKDNF